MKKQGCREDKVMFKDLSYQEMYEKFYKSYHSSIKSYLEILENERKTHLKRNIAYLIIFIICVVGAFVLLAVLHVNDNGSLFGKPIPHSFELSRLVRILVCLVMCACFSIAFFIFERMRQGTSFSYSVALKSRLMPLIIDCLGCIKYEQEGKPNLITKKDLLEHTYIDDRIFYCNDILEKHSKDIFKGCRNGVKFEIFEHYGNSTYIGLELNKKLKTPVIIKNKRTSVNRLLNIEMLNIGSNIIPIALLLIAGICFPTKFTISISLIVVGCFIWKLWTNLVVKKQKTLGLEDLNFNNKFSIYSDDEVEARYFATIAFIDRLMNLKLAFNATDIICSGFGNKLIFIIYTRENLFELGSLYKRVNTTKYIDEVFRQILSIMLIVDHFKLDEKTGL